MRSIWIVVLAGFMLAGCGQKLSGTYVPKKGQTGLAREAIIDRIEFVSSDSADITVLGQIRRLSYKLEGKKVIMTFGNESNVFTINDDGCLDGGQMIGKLCKAD